MSEIVTPRLARRLPRPSAHSITARDVAKVAGVSIATVSRTFNGGVGVAEALRARVITVARELGYTPHAAARALASQRSRTIGAVIPTLENSNFAFGIEALQRRLGEAGYTLLLASSDYDPAEELRQVHALAAHGVAGMMLVGAQHAPGLHEFLEAKRIPCVSAWVLDPDWPCVGFDNVEVGRALANYLLDLGHREFGVIAQFTGTSDRSAGRVAGVRDALARRGLSLPHERLIERPHRIIEGQLALRTMLHGARRPTAVICGTDVLAFGALVEARQQGIDVPRELSIAGINDVEFAAYLNPPLTTVRLPADEIGLRSAEYLLNCVRQHPVAPVTRLPFSVIVRGSTAPPPPSTDPGDQPR